MNYDIYKRDSRILLQTLFDIGKYLKLNQVDSAREELEELIHAAESDVNRRAGEKKSQKCFSCGGPWPDCMYTCKTYDKHENLA